MAEDSLVVDFLVRKNEIFSETVKVDKSMRLLDKSFNEVMNSGANMEKSISRTNVTLNEFDDIMGMLDKDIAQSSKSINTFDMRLLSVLFTGMALQRTFGGMFRAMTQTYAKAEDDTSELGKKTNELAASWEFFKFSLIDALGSDFFIGVIDGVIGVINWFGKLPEGVRAAITLTIGSLALIGTGALIYAQITMAWKAIFGIGGLLATSTATTATSVAVSTTAINTSLGTIVTAASAATIALGATLALVKLLETAGQVFEGYDQDAITLNEMGVESVDNLNQAQMELASGSGILTQEFSNVNKGMDRTMSLMTVINPETGKLEGHFRTTAEAITESLSPSLKELDIDFIAIEQSARAAAAALQEFDEAKSDISGRTQSSITTNIT